MASVIFSPVGKSDLAAIDDYSIEQFGEETAAAYVRGFNEVIDLLRRHPLAGADKSELGRGLRSITYRKHRIFYTFREDSVVIIRIIHHAQDAKLALN